MVADLRIEQKEGIPGINCVFVARTSNPAHMREEQEAILLRLEEQFTLHEICMGWGEEGGTIKRCVNK